MTAFRTTAILDLLDELQNNRLEVVKVQTPEGFKRVVCSQNAPWYQDFCFSYQKARKRYPKPRTIIKRCHTIRTLEALLSNPTLSTTYAQRLQPFIEDRQAYFESKTH
jgi:hypothetical protein